MMKAALTAGLLGVLLGIIPNTSLAKGPTADQVADRIQKLYDSTKDFQSAFTQEYTSRVLGKKKRSSGFVYIKKPGMMRWDYKKPRPKHFVANGSALYVYDPELEQVLVDRSFTSSSLTTAVTFLWGRGRLSEEFNITFSEPVGSQGSGRYRLTLIPKKQARFKKLFFVVDKKTYQVLETLVEDPGDNINHIIFSKISRNLGLKDEVFHLEIPDGIEVIEAPSKASSGP